MKRVLHIVGSLERGGLQVVALNCMKFSEKEKYQFDYLVYGDKKGDFEDEIIENGGNIIRVPYKKYNYILQYKQLFNVMREYGPYDIVHSHSFFNSGITMRAAAKNEIPKRIAHAHNVKRINDKRIAKALFNIVMRKWIKRYATDLCACSNAAGSYVFGKQLFYEKGIVLNNTIDIEKYLFQENHREYYRKQFGIQNNQMVIGNVGRMVEQKNHKRLIEIFCDFHNQYPDTVLLLVGDGELKDDLENYVKELKLTDCVIFAGSRKDVPNYLDMMDIFVTTSLYEGFGIVLIEAMANGLNCIGAKKVIVEEVASLEACTVVEDDIDSWISAIAQNKNRMRNSQEKVMDMLREYTPTYFEKEINYLYQ